jgi:hypothetical protein
MGHTASLKLRRYKNSSFRFSELRDVIYSIAVVEMTVICKFFQLKSTPVNPVDIRSST